jgi:hypothetical protein
MQKTGGGKLLGRLTSCFEKTLLHQNGEACSAGNAQESAFTTIVDAVDRLESRFAGGSG